MQRGRGRERARRKGGIKEGRLGGSWERGLKCAKEGVGGGGGGLERKTEEKHIKKRNDRPKKNFRREQPNRWEGERG